MNLTDGQKHVIGVVDAFCDEHFDEQSIQQWCISRGMPTHVYDAFYESELGGYVLPISVGGKDCPFLDRVTLIMAMVRRAGASLPIQSDMTALALLSSMRQVSQDEIVEDLYSKTGRVLFSQAFTEPNAGTDAAGQKTTAVDKGDYWLLNGTKIFITNAGPAEIYIVFAMTDKEKGNRGITAFIVEKDMEGFSIGKHEEKMGIRGSATAELVLEDVKVPKENMLGELNKGFKIAMMTLDGGRIGIAAQALGIAEGAIKETVEYVNNRVQFVKSISQFQNTQFELAQMAANTEAAKLLVYQAACAKDAGEPYSHLAAMAKLVAAQNASDVTRRCLQLYGGYGYVRDYPIERMMRDAKITEIYEGTSEVQKMVIANWLGVK